MTQLSIILKQRRKELGLTLAQIADEMGVAEATVQRWESGNIKSVRYDKIGKLAEVLKVQPSALMGWEDHAESKHQDHVPSGFCEMPETEFRPRVGRIACGDPITAEENIETYDEVLTSWHADFTLMCCGDSMSPKIENGDVVAIRAQPTVENGEIAAVRIGDEATLKRVFLHPDYIELRPINPNYESIIRRKEEMDDIKIEGLAVGLCRTL